MGKSVNEIIKKVIILPTCTPSFAQVPNALSFIFPPPFFFLGEFQLLIWLNFCLGWVFFGVYDCSCLDWVVILFGFDLDCGIVGVEIKF